MGRNVKRQPATLEEVGAEPREAMGGRIKAFVSNRHGMWVKSVLHHNRITDTDPLLQETRSQEQISETGEHNLRPQRLDVWLMSIPTTQYDPKLHSYQRTIPSMLAVNFAESPFL